MTKTTKSERKWGKDVDKKPPKTKINKIDVGKKPDIEMYKILVDNSGFSKPMSYDDCIKVIEEMELKAQRLRHPLPSLILIKQ